MTAHDPAGVPPWSDPLADAPATVGQPAAGGGSKNPPLAVRVAVAAAWAVAGALAGLMVNVLVAVAWGQAVGAEVTAVAGAVVFAVAGGRLEPSE